MGALVAIIVMAAWAPQHWWSLLLALPICMAANTLLMLAEGIIWTWFEMRRIRKVAKVVAEIVREQMGERGLN